MKCPKCSTNNPEDSKFCKECATSLTAADAVQPSFTRTLETPVTGLTRGTVFAERYEIIKELGVGGMGHVYRVEDTKITQEIALKLIKPEIASDKKTIERFRNELKTARMIAHKNVCRMFDLGEVEETHFITMEYVPGEDLKSFIRRSERLSVGKALSITKQICEGLSEAHRLGVVHRDMKPSNVMIDKRGDVRIMDFGIARSLDPKGITGEGVMIGTPEYMSPEQVEAKALDQRSDIYSLGVILFEMVTGQLPFSGDTALSIAMKHKGERPPSPQKLNPQIPDDLNRLILRCLAKNKEERFQSADEVLLDLDNIEKSTPTTQRPLTKKKTITPKEITLTLPRRKVVLPVLLIIAALVVSLVLWKPWQKTTTTDPSIGGKPSVAVLYFEDLTQDENQKVWRTALSHSLTTDLEQSEYIRVASTARVLSVLKRLKLDEVNSYSEDDLRKISEESNVEYVAYGSYLKAGDTFSINFKLQDPNTGQMLESKRINCESENEIISSIDEITKLVKQGLNLSPQTIASDSDKPLGTILSESPQALKYFSEGTRYYLRGDQEIAISLFERAIAVDPGLAMAYRHLAAIYWGLDDNKMKKYLHKAYALTDRVSERERYIIAGAYYRFIENDLDKGISTLETLVEKYPDDNTGHRMLMVNYRDLGNAAKAIEHGEKALQAMPGSARDLGNLIYSLQNIGEFEKAESFLRSFSEKNPELSRTWLNLALIYIQSKQFDKAQIELDRLYEINSDDIYISLERARIAHLRGDFTTAESELQQIINSGRVSNNLGIEHLSVLRLLQGRIGDSIELVTGLLNKDINESNKLNELRRRNRLAYLYLAQGNPTLAALESNAVLRLFDEPENKIQSESNIRRYKTPALFNLGVANLLLDSVSDAIESADRLNQFLNTEKIKHVLRLYPLLLGKIELRKRNFDKAINYLEQSISLTLIFPTYPISTVRFLDPLASAYFQAGESEKAQAVYKEIQDLTVGRIYCGDIYAKSYYNLGKIYEEQGDTVQAIEQYEKFLSLWKEADPGFVEVNDAQERLAKLKSN